MADAHQRPAQAEQPLGDLLRQLSEETQTLVRQELELAKAEMAEKGKAAGLGAGLFGGAGFMGFFAFAVITAAIVGALDTAMDFWLAALIVGAVYAAIAGVLAVTGKKEIQQVGSPKPDQTIETVKEDVEWAKTQARSGTR